MGLGYNQSSEGVILAGPLGDMAGISSGFSACACSGSQAMMDFGAS